MSPISPSRSFFVSSVPSDNGVCSALVERLRAEGMSVRTGPDSALPPADESQLVLCLASSSYLSSDHVREVQFPRLVPVLVSSPRRPFAKR